MPPGISAEHLGTVDQYYWDTFWSLAGLKAMVRIAAALSVKADEQFFVQKVQAFESDIAQSLQEVERRIGEKLIPATQDRSFDESAIGSISSIYPLELFEDRLHHLSNTLRKLEAEFVDERDFSIPSSIQDTIRISLSRSHIFFRTGRSRKAWEVAETIFRQATPPYSLP